MNLSLATFPTSIDMLHVGLAILILLFMALFFKKQRSSSDHKLGMQKQDVSSQASVKTQSKPVQLKESSPDAALQLLALLQQEARLIDFTQEDLSAYSDADVGAAARVVHEGSKKALNAYFTFAAIRSEDEESRITLPQGFNAAEVRLTGNVVGEAPFTGTLIHKGWKVTEVTLPKLTEGHDTLLVAPAEVEL
ncbi:MAG: hypothetical protein ACI8R9_002778 [Paraglaciecola sp.]|jgi:hypothetical protein